MLSSSQLKQNIRKVFKERRAIFNESDAALANVQLCASLLTILEKNYSEHAVYGFYLPIVGEPDLLNLALGLNAVIALPKVTDKEMAFVKYKVGDPIEKSSFSLIYQPRLGLPIIPKIIIVPGLCFSVKGDRLGFGVGHYDRYLAQIKQIAQPIIIGVCFQQNLLLTLPSEEHDQKMDYIVTDKVILKMPVSDKKSHSKPY